MAAAREVERTIKLDELELPTGKSPEADRTVAAYCPTELLGNLEIAERLVGDSLSESCAAADGERSEGRASRTVPPTTPGNEEDDHSIQDYLQRLLQRTNGYSGPAAKGSATAVPVQPAAEPAVPPATDFASTAAKADPRISKPAPECRQGLQQMREIANSNTRTALDAHTGRKTADAMQNNLLVTGAFLVLSCALAGMSSTVASFTFWSSLLALGLASLWTYRYFRLAAKLTEYPGIGETGGEPLVAE